MPDDENFEQMLEQLGFTPVDHAEVERVEASVRTQVVERVTDRLQKQQEDLEKARTWYVA